MSRPTMRTCTVILVIAASLQLLPGPGTANAQSAASEHWQQQNPLVPEANLTLQQIACPSVSVCYVLSRDGTVLRTEDDGRAWNVQSKSTAAALACPNIAVCFGMSVQDSQGQVSSTIISSSDGARTWTTRWQAKNVHLADLACFSTTVCYAVGVIEHGDIGPAFVLSTRDGGTTWRSWKRKSQLQMHEDWRTITCPGATVCIVAAIHGPGDSPDLWVTRDGGESWTQHPIRGAGGAGFSWTTGSLACPSATICFVLRVDVGDVLVTTDGGSSWHRVKSGATGKLRSISCSSTTVCVVLGDGGELFATSDGGGSWRHQSSGTGNQLVSVACPDPITCYAVGGLGTIIATHDGHSWTVQTQGMSNSLSSVACPALAVCFAVGDAGTILETRDGGSSWHRAQSGATGNLRGIACTSTTRCLAVGSATSGEGAPEGAGIILTTTDAGQIWQSTQRSRSLVAVACPTDSICYAVDFAGTVLRTKDSGSTWSNEGAIGGSAPPLSIACPGTDTCYAVVNSDADCEENGCLSGERGVLATNDKGQTWHSTFHRVSKSESDPSLNAIACPGEAVCYVGGGGSLMSTRDGGRTWRDFAGSHLGPITSLACPTTEMCRGATNHGIIVGTDDGGTTWRVTASADRGLTAIACPGVGRCYAVGQRGLIMASTLLAMRSRVATSSRPSTTISGRGGGNRFGH